MTSQLPLTPYTFLVKPSRCYTNCNNIENLSECHIHRNDDSPSHFYNKYCSLCIIKSSKKISCLFYSFRDHFNCFAYLTHVVHGIGQEVLFCENENVKKLLVFEALYP